MLAHLRHNKRFRRFTSNKRGFSSIIGAAFAVIIIMSLASTVFLWSLTQNTEYNNAVRQSNLADLDRSNERIATEVTSTGESNSVWVNGTLENYGSLPVKLVSLWVVDENNKYNHIALDLVLPPGTITTVGESVPFNSPGDGLSCWFISERGNTISEKPMSVTNNYVENSSVTIDTSESSTVNNYIAGNSSVTNNYIENNNSSTYANVAGGIGLIGFDFKAFRHYDIDPAYDGWEPSNNYLVGTLDTFSDTYSIIADQYTIFHVVLTNWDPANNTMYLESTSAIYVIGAHAGTTKYYTWALMNTTGNEETGIRINPFQEATYVLPPREPVHVYFAGMNPRSSLIDQGQVYPLNILVHGKLDSKDYGQNVPFVTLYFG